MGFLSRLSSIRWSPYIAYCHYPIHAKPINFLRLLKLCRSSKDLKHLNSLLILHGLCENDLLIREFFTTCFNLGAPHLALSAFQGIQKTTMSLQNLMIRFLCHHGLYEDLISLYLSCRFLGCPSDDFTFPFVIKACAAVGAVKIGKEIHCVVLRTGFDQNLVIQTALVDFYAKIGCLRNAQVLLDRIPEPDLVCWNALIAGYSSNGLDREAFEVFRQIYLKGLKPNLSTLASIIPVCARLGWFETGKSIHSLAVKSGYFLKEFLVPALISMYVRDGDLYGARNLFDSAPRKNETVWNAMISAYTQMQESIKAFHTFKSMMESDTRPNSITLVSIIPSCEKMNTKSCGESLHALAITHGLENQLPVFTSHISMYAKLDDIDSAKYIFDQIPNKTCLSWNSMISCYLYNGLWDLSLDAFRIRQFEGYVPDAVSIISSISACSKLKAILPGKSVHAFSMKNGLDSNINVSNALLAFYSDFGYVSSSFRLFFKMPIRCVVSWNTLLACCIHNREMEMATSLFQQMQRESIEPDLVTLISILPSLSDSRSLIPGMAIHCNAIKIGFASDVSLVNALISMYFNCGNLDHGSLLFSYMPEKDVVSWNAIITGFRYNELHSEVIHWFKKMIKDKQRPNHVTLLNILSSCHSQLQGKSVHGFAVRTGVIQETSLITSLVVMYARFNSINSCLLLFQMGKKEDISLWNAMMSVHIQIKNARMAIAFFADLLHMGLEPDNYTVLCLIIACIQLNNISLANSIFPFLICNGFDKEVAVRNALIDLYARCGDLSIARKLFDQINEKDIVSWNVMINGYGLHGDGKAAIDLFLQMELSGIKPDVITFSTILSACSHSGLVQQGLRMFKSMEEKGIPPKIEHYACIVDLLARTGHLVEAYNMGKKLLCDPPKSMLESLLGACSIYGNVDLGEQIARKLFDLDPENSRAYVMFYNIYAGAGRWKDAAKVRSEMEEKKLRKIPGFSLVVGDGFHDN